MHNREGLTLKRLWTAVCDYDLWPLYLIGLMFPIPSGPPSAYLTLSLRNLGSVPFPVSLFNLVNYVLLQIFNLQYEPADDPKFGCRDDHDVWDYSHLRDR